MMTKLTQKPLAMNDKGSQMNRMPNPTKISREMSWMNALAIFRNGELNILLLLLSLLVLISPGRVQAAVPDVNPSGAYIEAEDYLSMGAPNPWAWGVQTNVSGFQGTGYLYSTNGGTGTQPNGSRIDFPVNFTSGGTYRMWLRARDQAGNGGGDSTFWGVDGVVMGALTEGTDNTWSWTTRLQNGTNTASISAGNHTINLWPREAGQHTDSIFIIRTDQTLPANISEASTAGVPTGHSALDFSGSGPGAGYVTFPEGQSINGGPITLLDTTVSGIPGSQQLEYQTDLSGLQYRALGGQTDGFPGFALNSKWTKTDIGGDSTTAPTANDGSATLFGAGANIWSTRDFFSYLYQNPVSGDFTIDVNVSSLISQNTYTKAGIMVRQSLTANSKNVAALVTGGAGSRIQYRATDGGSTTNATGSNGLSAPRWLRLVRSGNLFTAYQSTDGLSWTQISGTANVSFVDPVYIGLAVTSNSSGNAATADFKNFHFMPAATSGMSTTWGAVSGSIDTTGWATGTYGLALNSGGTFETASFAYVDCVDATPSTITVPGGQTVGGTAVSLNALFNTSGNVGTFVYQVNGVQVNNPWNSYSEVADGNSGPVTLTVLGTDPDCDGSQVSGSGTITVDNSCSDPTPSTLTILTGQGTGGSTVDLTAMVSQTGNIGSLAYKINGATIATPSSWDSTGYGLAAAESVTLEVTGTDPDCGSVVTALNSIEINNTCTRNPPSISFDRDIHHVGPGRAVPYKVTIRNEDSPNCGSSTFDVAIIADPVNADFVASFFNPLGSNSNITLAGRESATFELAVQAEAGATEWAEKDTTVEITSSYTGTGNIHNSPKTSGTVTTKVFLLSPITHNSVTTNSSKWGGSWGTSEPGSKYGNFDCLICHVTDGPNVKWLLDEILLPGADWGTGATAEHLPVAFQDARPNGDWGHDDPNEDGSGRTSSTRACEVCHTITKHHRYDTNGDPVDPPEGPVGPQTIVAGQTHFPNRDCIDCHRHSLGFTASCIGCHGDPPLEATLGGPNGLANIPAATGSVTPGTHYKHTVVLDFPCEYCHAGWRDLGEMPKQEPNSGQQQINHTFAVFGSSEPAATAGQYTGQDGVNYQPVADLLARGVQDANGTVQPGQGNMTCENIYCHGGTDNMGGTNPQWNGNIACNSCHGTSATNTPPGYSHTTHVGQMGIACTSCHGLSTGVGANGHVSGSVHIDLSELATTYSSPAAVYNGVGGTANGVKWDSDRLAPSDPDVTDGTDLYGTCSNVACHFGNDTPVWNNNNQPATCTLCHNDGSDTGLLDNAAPVTGAHAKHRAGTLMAAAFIDQCQSCHGGGANIGNHAGHVDFNVDFATNVSWVGANRNCTNTCHDGNSIANLWDSPNDLDCSACHKAPFLGPTVVDPTGAGAGMAASGYGSHLKTTKSQTISGATDWYSQCKECHPYHSGGSAVVPQPPSSWDNPGTAAVESDDMAFKLGLQFPITGGIHLGGTATSGSTEADICWNCHGTDSEINEWGYNADTNSANFPETKLAPDTTSPAGHSYWDDGGARGSYNYGYLYTNNHASGTYSSVNATSKWVASNGWGNYRRDGYQHTAATSPGYVLSRRITSVHSVNFTGANQVSSVATAVDGSGNVNAAAQETAANIRCSYCHDVHDLNRAVTDIATATNETQTGRPYLRGTWMGNPYAADVPPISSYESAYNADNGNHYTGASGSFPGGLDTPRLFSHSSTSKMKGGFFIDANSNRPTTNANYDTLEETAGICITCHGSDVNNMDFYGASMWRSDQVNGHANSTLGGGGAGHANARNIFDARRGFVDNDQGMGNQSAVGQGAEFGQNPFDQRAPFGNAKPMQEAMNTNDPQIPASGWYGGTPGADYDGGTRPGDYSAWYSAGGIGTDGSGSGRAHSFTCSKCHSPHATGLPALLITNCLDKNISTYAIQGINPNVPQATNCHRNEGANSGWNRLAPAQ